MAELRTHFLAHSTILIRCRGPPGASYSYQHSLAVSTAARRQWLRVISQSAVHRSHETDCRPSICSCSRHSCSRAHSYCMHPKLYARMSPVFYTTTSKSLGMLVDTIAIAATATSTHALQASLPPPGMLGKPYNYGYCMHNKQRNRPHTAVSICDEGRVQWT